ncbi:MAG: hypothetical protein AUH92_05645 [Acidobacteria bacterium 13_1_40CM_4_69_4]|nr:MAG: hypothetical protein AUH92_05645 [Acidobacteria bacterium 13_1_40CM_4_69_4]
MSTLRARRHDRFLPSESFPSEVLLTVRAGQNLVLRVAAVDRQSGIAEIIARCRSRENFEMNSLGRWSPRMSAPPERENYYPIVIPIPSASPTVVWELHQITLRDREGNSRSYVPGRDFDEMLFKVLGRDGIDSTPPRLLGIKIGTA